MRIHCRMLYLFYLMNYRDDEPATESLTAPDESDTVSGAQNGKSTCSVYCLLCGPGKAPNNPQRYK